MNRPENCHFTKINPSKNYLWANSNNRTRGQCECDVTWFCFCFDFVRSHARCGCCSIVLFEEVGGGSRGVGGGGGSFEIGRPRSRGWEHFGRRWTGGEGS